MESYSAAMLVRHCVVFLGKAFKSASASPLFSKVNLDTERNDGMCRQVYLLLCVYRRINIFCRFLLHHEKYKVGGGTEAIQDVSWGSMGGC